MSSFYTPNLKPDSKTLTIDGSEYNHIANVFRKRVGDTIRLNSGDGLIAEAEITEIGKKQLDVNIIEIKEFTKSEPHLAVAFALLRNKHDELIIEKLTELGVKEFFPFTSENTVRKPGNNTLSRFESTAVAAMKQCDNPFLPIIHPVMKLSEAMKVTSEKGFKTLIASELEGEPRLNDVVQTYNEPFCIFIGPEGGFSPSEFTYFKSNDGITYKLCNRVLRAETAAITSVAQLIGEYLKLHTDYQ